MRAQYFSIRRRTKACWELRSLLLPQIYIRGCLFLISIISCIFSISSPSRRLLYTRRECRAGEVTLWRRAELAVHSTPFLRPSLLYATVCSTRARIHSKSGETMDENADAQKRESREMRLLTHREHGRLLLVPCAAGWRCTREIRIPYRLITWCARELQL